MLNAEISLYSRFLGFDGTLFDYFNGYDILEIKKLDLLDMLNRKQDDYL